MKDHEHDDLSTARGIMLALGIDLIVWGLAILAVRSMLQ
jgi:hypothetical protein